MSYLPTHDDVLEAMQLHWWRLHGYAHDSEGGRLSIDGWYERRGFLGLTVVNMGAREEKEIRAWVKSHPRVYISKKDYSDGERWVIHWLGEYRDFCINFWFPTQALLDKFIALLEAFPKRTTVLIQEYTAEIRGLVRGTNYMVLKGTEATAIAISEDVKPTTLMKLRLVAKH